MEIAKVTSKGQITVPKEVRKQLELEAGSKIVFIRVGDDLVVRNAEAEAAGVRIDKSAQSNAGLYRLGPESLPAFRRLQEAFEGFAEEERLETEEDVAEWLKTQRREGR